MITSSRREFRRASSLAFAGEVAGGCTTTLSQQSPASVGPLKPAPFAGLGRRHRNADEGNHSNNRISETIGIVLPRIP